MTENHGTQVAVEELGAGEKEVASSAMDVKQEEHSGLREDAELQEETHTEASKMTLHGDSVREDALDSEERDPVEAGDETAENGKSQAEIQQNDTKHEAEEVADQMFDEVAKDNSDEVNSHEVSSQEVSSQESSVEESVTELNQPVAPLEKSAEEEKDSHGSVEVEIAGEAENAEGQEAKLTEGADDSEEQSDDTQEKPEVDSKGTDENVEQSKQALEEADLKVPDAGLNAEVESNSQVEYNTQVESNANVNDSAAQVSEAVDPVNEVKQPVNAVVVDDNADKVERGTKPSVLSKKESKKRTGKNQHGTSENPIDITDLTVDSGSLLQLYQNDYFDAYMHMHHLYHKKEAGVHEYLVNLLYSKRTNEEVMFYLPQLCQLSISKYGKSSLHRFLLDKASTSMHFALKLSWFYQAIISDKASKIGHLAQKMTQETEMAVVNCKLISPVSSCKAPVEDRELNVCSKNLLLRRGLINGIRGRNLGGVNQVTEMDMLDTPKFSKQLSYNTSVLVCPESKVKLPTPYIKIGNPFDLEIQPHVDCPDEIRYELERLMMKQRRLDYFNMLSNFVKLSMDVSKLLTAEPKRDSREPLLTMFAKSINEWMLLQRCAVAAYEETFAYRGLSFPMRNMGHDKVTNIPFQFLRIVEDEIKIFFSKKRAPFVFYFEIANLDEDVKLISENWGDKASEKVSFDDLYVFEAIVKDLVSSGLLEVAEVERIKNPLECIRYALGMLPSNFLERSQRASDKFDSTLPPDSHEADDPDNMAIETNAKDGTSGLKAAPTEESDSSRALSRTQSNVDSKYPIIEQMSAEEARAVIFPELLKEKKERLRRRSPYGHLKSWNIRAVIVKGGDDLRQEYMVNQLLSLFRDIFAGAQLPLWLKPIEILVTGPNCGIIEFLHDTCSVDVIKRKFNVESVGKVFERVYADKIYEARKNFIESHAAYSIISYLLQVKDRHNGNMMLDSEGHIVHIDYGFCLSNTPGNINFETSPFKLTKEYLDIIGGESSDNFEYFRTLVIRGLLEARKHMDRIVLLVEMMTDAHKMPCFAAGTSYTMDMFKDRFMLNLSEDVCIDRIVAMIEESVNNFRTVQYDNFQRLTNGIK